MNKTGSVWIIFVSASIMLAVFVQSVKAPGVTEITALDVSGYPWNMLRGRTYRFYFQVQTAYTVDVEVSYWLSPPLDPLVVSWYDPPPITILPAGLVIKNILFNVTVPFDAPIKDYSAGLGVRFQPVGGGISSVYTMLPQVWRVVGPVCAILDIDPDTLNVRNNGQWITTYIELEQGFNVYDIDTLTVKINDSFTGDPSVAAQIGDYDSDGVYDLAMKFDRSSMVDWLGTRDYGPDIGRYYETYLTIAGTVAGKQFTGIDKIKVLRG